MSLYLSKKRLSCITAAMERAALMYWCVPFSASAASSEERNICKRARAFRLSVRFRLAVSNLEMFLEVTALRTDPLANHLHHLFGLGRLLLDLHDASKQVTDRLLRLLHVGFGRTADFRLIANLESYFIACKGKRSARFAPPTRRCGF